MIKLNNPDHANAEPLIQEELGNIVTHFNIFFSDMPDMQNICQRLIDNYQNLLHFQTAAGGWEGLVKLQEIADNK